MGAMTDATPPGQVEWTTLRGAAEIAGVSTKTVRRALKAGTIVGQRGTEQNDPWQIRVDTVEARWGRTGAPRRQTTGQKRQTAAALETSTLALQLESFAQMLNEARQAEAEARERAARAETENEHLRERLAALRDPETPDKPPKEKDGRTRRWWNLKR